MKKQEKNNPLIKYKKILGIVLLLIIYSILITGSTYAFMSFNANSTAATGTGGCFQVSYTGQEITGGDFLSTDNYSEGANTTVTLSKDSTCKIYSEANIYLHTNDTTTAPIESTPALRFKLFNGTTEISEGLISNKKDTLLTTVPITNSSVTYTIYLWVDNNLSDGLYHDTAYSGYIYAESAQTSTIENSYLVNFNTSGGNEISQKVVTYGSTYGTLPTPTRSGYTFKGWSLTPSEYQQVEYIESSGTQYIITDIVPSTEFKLIADIYQSSTYTGESAFAGARDSSDDKGVEYYFAAGKPKFWVYNGSNQSALGGDSTNTFYNQKIHYEATRTATQIAMKTSVTDQKTSTFSSTGSTITPLMLFAYNFKGTANYLFIGRIYSTKIYGNEKLVGNYIPCKNTMNNNEVGLYDTVTGKFYGNAGNGSFTAGNATYITSSSTVNEARNHTLYAVWE